MKHLACIMSGNRRWALQNKCSLLQGYQEGFRAIERTIDFCLEKKILYFSGYAFSLENFRRPLEQQKMLFSFLAHHATKKSIEKLRKKRDQVCFLGDQSVFSVQVQKACSFIAKETVISSPQLQLNLLFGYSGQQELVAGIKKMIPDIKSGKIAESELSKKTLENYLWTKDIPAPDLIFRPDNDQRLSGFFLYQSAYSELYFSDCMWPAVNSDVLEEAYAYFHRCQRNFGR